MTIEAAILAWLLAQPVHASDRDESDRASRMSQVAEAIGVVSAGNRKLAASLMILAREEGGLRRDVQHGECPKHLCDRGRARGLPQLHRPPSVSEGVWLSWAGTEYSNVLGSFVQAANMLRAGFAKCHTTEGALAYYATGGRCVWSGAERRDLMVRELEGRL